MPNKYSFLTLDDRYRRATYFEIDRNRFSMFRERDAAKKRGERDAVKERGERDAVKERGERVTLSPCTEKQDTNKG